MPFIQAHGSLMLHTDHSQSHHWLPAWLLLPIYILTAILVVIILSTQRRTGFSLANRLERQQTANDSNNCKAVSPVPLSRAAGGPIPSLDGWVSPRHGRVFFGQLTSRAEVSRGGTRDTAFAVFAPAGKRQRMEEGEGSISHPKPRQVRSPTCENGSQGSYGQPDPRRLGSMDVGVQKARQALLSSTFDRTDSDEAAHPFEDGRQAVGYENAGDSIRDPETAVARLAFAHEQVSKISTLPLAHYMTDDEHVQYGANNHDHRTRRRLSPSRQQPRLISSINTANHHVPPLVTDDSSGGTQTAISGGPEYSMELRASESRGSSRSDGHLNNNIPADVNDMYIAPGATDDRDFWADAHSQSQDSRKFVGMDSGGTLSASSSYPSVSPLLPPPPPTASQGFDPAMIMFPGPGAADGGVRIVPAPGTGHVEPGHHHQKRAGAVEDYGDGWRRHTRVYGGGVCLACAGGGGFYGARVRPEDRRRP